MHCKASFCGVVGDLAVEWELLRCPWDEARGYFFSFRVSTGGSCQCNTRAASCHHQVRPSDQCAFEREVGCETCFWLRASKKKRVAILDQAILAQGLQRLRRRPDPRQLKGGLWGGGAEFLTVPLELPSARPGPPYKYLVRPAS